MQTEQPRDEKENQKSILNKFACSMTILAGLSLSSCSKESHDSSGAPPAPAAAKAPESGNREVRLNENTLPPRPAAQAQTTEPEFEVKAEAFADLQLLRYQVPEFDSLTLQQKKLAYYLSEAALAGRDIIYDQKDKNGLLVRKTLENMYATYSGDTSTEEWRAFKEYCGRFWFSSGNHHHYGNDKFIPECSARYFSEVAHASKLEGFPLRQGESLDQFLARIEPTIFDPNVNPKLVDLRPGIDNVLNSSINFYEGVTQAEVEAFYGQFNSVGNAPSWGLNSKVVKENGAVIEKPWKVGGMYGEALEPMVQWLEKAAQVAENEKQQVAIEKLIKFFRSGSPADFDEYCIAWVADKDSRIDAVVGFIEVYNDPIGKKASYESVVSLRDLEATKRINAIAECAQWFEDNSPIMAEHKKAEVTGISAKAITVIMETGDAAPSTPIGINLPNSDWIRKDHGSKSVSLSNIVHSYNISSATSGVYSEFAYDASYVDLNKTYGALSSDLHTDMHECIGHASGQINPGVDTPEKTLKNYAPCLEEARADLVALYYILDPKLVEIGVAPNLDVGRNEYNSYITNGLITQLTRLKLGDNLEEAHMRNRQLIAAWAYEHGKADGVIEFVKRDDKTFVKINDYEKLRTLFGELLREIQRIKSEGDFTSGQSLVETYGVKVDQELLKEVLERFQRLDAKPYKGFVQPEIIPIVENGEIVDVKVGYPESFFEQMIQYGKKYSFLPVEN